jgi:3-deoxy-D-manno-octulosonic-acid transferase
MLRRLWQRILDQLSCVLAQTELDAERLRVLGCRADRVTVAGNLKFDVRSTQEAEATRLLKSGMRAVRFVVAGSTLEGEEAALLLAWPRLLAIDPNLELVLAPRHPERFPAVGAMLESSGLAWSRRSEWKGQPDRASVPVEPGRVILLDTIGELASVYSLAAVAFVGGSVVPAGGHNPLEPAQFGVPIVMGPHYANFRAITDDLRAHDAIRIAERDDLAEVLISLLVHKEEASAIGERALQVFQQQAGATARSVNAILEVLNPKQETARSAVMRGARGRT